MGYWGYGAMESDSALDAMFNVTALLEKMWNGATDYGEKMAVVYILTEAPEVDGNDYRGLKAKAVTFVAGCMTRLDEEDVDNSGSVGEYCEAFNKKQEEITYLQGLIEKLQKRQSTLLGDKLVEVFEDHVCDVGNKWCQEGADPGRHPDHDSHAGGCNCPLGQKKYNTARS